MNTMLLPVSLVFLSVALVAAVMVLSGAGCQPESQTPAASSAAPSHATSLGQGMQPAQFLKQQGLEGRVVFIEFGMVGCDLSEAGLVKMMGLKKDKEIPGLEFLRVDVTQEQAEADKYFAAKTPGFAVVRDADKSVTHAFDAGVLPTFVLVDKFGRVRYRGAFPELPQLADWADTLAREKTDPGPQVALFGVSRVDEKRLLAETKLPDLQGTVKPLADYMGKRGLLVVFVDTRCPFSGQAISEMSQVAQALAQFDVPGVVVNIDDPKDAVLKFYSVTKTGTPVVYDDARATMKAWKVDSVPTVVVFAADGTVGYRGRAAWADVASAAEGALKLPKGSIRITPKGTSYG